VLFIFDQLLKLCGCQVISSVPTGTKIYTKQKARTLSGRIVHSELLLYHTDCFLAKLEEGILHHLVALKAVPRSLLLHDPAHQCLPVVHMRPNMPRMN
jgi:hypothetical protein